VIRDDHGVRYNGIAADWVESCTALVEHEDGRFEIITGSIRRRAKRWCRRCSPCGLIRLIRDLARLRRARLKRLDDKHRKAAVTPADIDAAAKVIAPYAVRTPLL